MVANGVAVGLETVAEDKFVVGDQLYVLPATAVVPNETDGVAQVTVALAPAFAEGGVLLTVTTIISEQVLSTVSVYVVVTVGFAVGCAMVVELKPVEGLQE